MVASCIMDSTCVSPIVSYVASVFVCSSDYVMSSEDSADISAEDMNGILV